MAKMRKEEGIVDWEYNIKQLVADEETCIQLIQIRYDEIHKKDLNIAEKIEKELGSRYNSRYYKESEKKQIGKVWMLVKQLEYEKYEVLQVAQALEYKWKKNKGYWHELRSHVNSILTAINRNIEGEEFYTAIGEMLEENQILTFYEIVIDNYLEKYAPDNNREIIYEMAKEYYTEAAVAFYTQADWGFYNSGMDKRAFYRIFEDNKDKKIDEIKKNTNSKFD